VQELQQDHGVHTPGNRGEDILAAGKQMPPGHGRRNAWEKFTHRTMLNRPWGIGNPKSGLLDSLQKRKAKIGKTENKATQRHELHQFSRSRRRNLNHR